MWRKKLESAGGNEDVTLPSRKEKMQIIGKKNLIIIFCIYSVLDSSTAF